MTDRSGLEPDLAGLRTLVYRTFAEDGRPPSIAEAARLLGRAEPDVRAGLAELHRRHLLVLAPDGDAIRMAHPFSGAPMGFVVRSGDERWWGGCTWDSFGIGAALGRDVRIDSTCPRCLAELRFEAGPDRAPEPALIVRMPLPAQRWWDDVVWTCTRIRTFCSAEHAVEFAAGAGEELGRLVPLETIWRLAMPWYGDRLRADYAPRPRDAAQALLEGAGLTGDFWRLP